MAVDYISPSSFSVPGGTQEPVSIGYAGPSIIDIRGDVEESNILGDILKGLKPESGQAKTLPTLLLYDEAGLKMFERITYLTEYYLTNAEIDVLTTYVDRIAECVPDNAVLLELGSGNLRKINLLLHALDRIGKRIDYYALDLDDQELRRTLAAVPHGTFKNVKCHGLHGTYDDGLVWLKRPEIDSKPKCVLSLGSSIGNFDPEEVTPFLHAYAKTIRAGDSILIGMDKTMDAEKVTHAYNDKYGVTHEFILNGLVHANRLLGWEAFEPGVWKVHGEFDKVKGCHEAFVYPNKNVTFEDITVQQGERIRIEHSYKFSDEKAAKMWKEIGVTPGAKWTNTEDSYAIHQLLV